MEVVLASASPRRLALLEQVGVQARVCPADFDEEAGRAESAHQVALHNALGKCRAVAAQTGDAVPVVAADTIVVIDDAILGKPQNALEAAAMLTSLSGRSHQVLTGVAVRYQGKELAQVCATKVYFRQLTEVEIAAYVATGEPLDKAGAYGIQGKGTILVEKIEGCYNNVVGLPLTMLYSMLKEIGVIMTV
ncbi:MAG: Maf family protein [Phascolarctobacterium sp.]